MPTSMGESPSRHAKTRDPGTRRVGACRARSRSPSGGPPRDPSVTSAVPAKGSVPAGQRRPSRRCSPRRASLPTSRRSSTSSKSRVIGAAGPKGGLPTGRVQKDPTFFGSEQANAATRASASRRSARAVNRALFTRPDAVASCGCAHQHLRLGELEPARPSAIAWRISPFLRCRSIDASGGELDTGGVPLFASCLSAMRTKTGSWSFSAKARSRSKANSRDGCRIARATISLCALSRSPVFFQHLGAKEDCGVAVRAERHCPGAFRREPGPCATWRASSAHARSRAVRRISDPAAGGGVELGPRIFPVAKPRQSKGAQLHQRIRVDAVEAGGA